MCTACFELRRTSKMALQYIGMTILRVLQLKNRRRENLPSVQETEEKSKDEKEEEKGKEEGEEEKEKEEDEVDDEEEDDVFTPLEVEEVDGETNKPSSKAGNSSTSSSPPPPSPRKKQVDTLTLRPGRTLHLGNIQDLCREGGGLVSIFM